jgi:hypothetical protein
MTELVCGFDLAGALGSIGLLVVVASSGCICLQVLLVLPPLEFFTSLNLRFTF